METISGYYDDNEILTFQADVLQVNKTDKNYEVILDKTYFYPEGGGQPADRGIIDNCKVINVLKTDGQIIHLCDKEPSQGTVNCKIDENWRFDFMQQHTGQHIVSGALKQIGDYNTVSVHLGT